MNDIYDVIIIGAGPGGLSAGIYSARSKLKTLIIEKRYYGGQMVNTGIIENYPGSLLEDTGGAIAERMVEQCKNFDVEFAKDEVIGVELKGNIKTIECKKNTYKTKTVIIAIGCKHKNLGVDREEEFLGRGLSHCAICDGNIFRGLPVYVAGGGESAAKESVYLSRLAKSVTILNKNEKLKCSKYIEDKCNDIENISIINNVLITKLLGDDILNGIVAKNVKTNQEITFKAEDEDGLIGLFVFVGMAAQTDLFKGLLDFDEKGNIKTDEKMQTNIDGVYAVGDCRSKEIRQIVTASNDGAIAAISAEKYIN